MTDSQASERPAFGAKTVLNPESSSFRKILSRPGFQPFFWTQSLGALNRNLYIAIVSFRAMHAAGYFWLAGAALAAPFLLFSGYAGYLAGRFRKRSVLIGAKAFEIFAMTLGLASFFSTRIAPTLAALFLIALDAAIFSPAKYGILAEILPEQDLSRANALLEMSASAAIVLAGFAGWIFRPAEPWVMGLAMMGLAMIAVAIAGFLVSLRIPATGTAPSGESFAFTGTRGLLRDRPMLLAVIAISSFWFLAALVPLDLLLVGREVMKLSDVRIAGMLAALVTGFGAGSMLAGRLSGEKIELALAPIGAAWIGIGGITAYLATSYTAFLAALALMGMAGGLFLVPMSAYLQQRGEPQEKGRILAANNFCNFLGVALAVGALYALHNKWHVSADKILLIFGVATLISSGLAAREVPEILVRFSLWLLMHSLYKIRIAGRENIPFRGPALVVANHTTHIDGFFLAASMQRLLRFMIWRPYYEMKAMHWFFRFAKAIPVGTSGPRDTVAQIRAARKELTDGHAVGIFAEGAITRTGNLLPFKRGMERILEGLDVPIIPVHIDNLWGSLFSFSGGRFFWKRPKQLRRRITVSFGAPMPPDSTPFQVQQAVAALSSAAVEFRKTPLDTLPLRFIRSARKNWPKLAMADSTGREITYGRALAAGLAVSRWLRKHRREEARIGVMLAAPVEAALANAGISMGGKISVNLNFTAGADEIRVAIGQCGIRTILTSKKFLTDRGLDALEGMAFVEEILAAEGLFDTLSARLAPSRWLVARASPDSPAAILFSGGSEPKAVLLSHYNVIANIEAMVQVFWLDRSDRIVGALPFFHAFGFTVTLWLPLVNGSSAVYHASPAGAEILGGMVEKYQGTLLVSTPALCDRCARECTAQQFTSLRYALAGLGKEPVRRAFEDAFGIELLEGYLCTEMSPVVAVNGPGYEAGRESQVGTKRGTAGHPLPGVAARIVDPETMAELGPDQEGLLLVKGANRMLGYWNDPERTAAAIENGWYRTGDFAAIDEDGFLSITDRMSRNGV